MVLLSQETLEQLRARPQGGFIRQHNRVLVTKTTYAMIVAALAVTELAMMVAPAPNTVSAPSVQIAAIVARGILHRALTHASLLLMVSATCLLCAIRARIALIVSRCGVVSGRVRYGLV